MRASRSLQRAKLKQERKAAKAQFNKITRVIENTRKSCLKCSVPFDNRNPEHLDNWRVLVYDDRAELYCEKCYDQPVNQENADEQGTQAESV